MNFILAPHPASANKGQTNVNLSNSYSAFPVTHYPNTVVNVSICVTY